MRLDIGLHAAAVFDVDGKLLTTVGALDNDELRAIGTVLTGRMREGDLLARMLEGELITSSLDDREIEIGIVANCVFVVVVPGPYAEASRIAGDALRSDIARVIGEARADTSGSRSSPPPGSGGSSSGPAELPVIEWGVTVSRRDRN